jgi:hypothetical protein
MNDMAIQVRCVKCLREQYAPAVISISRGEHPCVWCGEPGKKMTEAEYRQAINEARKAKK